MSARGDNWWRAYAVLSRGLALANRIPIGERSVKIGPDRGTMVYTVEMRGT